jgi:hypothetical protein
MVRERERSNLHQREGEEWRGATSESERVGRQGVADSRPRFGCAVV